MAINSPLGENSVFDPSFEWQGDANRDQSKYLLIEYVSAELNTINIQGGIKTVTLEFKVTGSNLNSRNATFQLYSLQNNYFKKPYKVYTVAINNNGSKTITISIPQILLIEQDLRFEVIVTCDGISSTTGSFSLTGTENEKSAPPSKCFCKNQEWDANDLKYIVSQLRKKEGTGLVQTMRDKSNTKNYAMGEPMKDSKGNIIKKELSIFDSLDDKKEKPIGDRLFYLNVTENIAERERNYNELVKWLNYIFRETKAIKCINKIHILCQFYHETQRFSSSYESDSSAEKSGEDFYRGRGLVMLTKQTNYTALYKFLYKKDATEAELKQFVRKIASSIEYAAKAAVWYLNSQNVQKYFNDDFVERVTAAINYPKALETKNYAPINGLTDRKKFFNMLMDIMNYEECH